MLVGSDPLPWTPKSLVNAQCISQGGSEEDQGLQKGSKRGPKGVYFGVQKGPFWGQMGRRPGNPGSRMHSICSSTHPEWSQIHHLGSPNTCFEGPKSGVFRSGSSIPNTKCLYSDIYV
jgi:hypothetical protein